MHHIKLTYLYRDASNYKLYGSKVFSNNTNLPRATIQSRLESQLIDGTYFVPEKWGIERLEFEGVANEDDHSWHELESVDVCSSDEKPVDDIMDLLRLPIRAL